MDYNQNKSRYYGAASFVNNKSRQSEKGKVLLKCFLSTPLLQVFPLIMFNFAARPLSEHTAKPIDGFKRGTGPFIRNLQYIKTCYRIKYYQKLSIVDIASQGVRST